MDGDLKDVLLPVGVLGTIALGIIYFVRTLTSYYLKKKLIERDLVNTDASQILNERQSESKYSSLKWGLIILFGGIGLIIINSIEYYRDSPLPFGIFAVSVAVGFLLYYFIVKRETSS